MTRKNLKEYAGFTVGEKVRYLHGIRNGMMAIVETMSRHPLSDKSIVFYLVFDNTLPTHLQTQEVTFPQNATWIEKMEQCAVGVTIANS
jgi:hypothetical protein